MSKSRALYCNQIILCACRHCTVTNFKIVGKACTDCIVQKWNSRGGWTEVFFGAGGGINWNHLPLQGGREANMSRAIWSAVMATLFKNRLWMSTFLLWCQQVIPSAPPAILLLPDSTFLCTVEHFQMFYPLLTNAQPSRQLCNYHNNEVSLHGQECTQIKLCFGADG